MSFYESHDAELQLDTLMHRGQWVQALAAVDEWLGREPGRVELLLRRAQILRALHRYELGLLTIREFRARMPDAGVAYLEVEFLLALGRATDALRLLDALPAGERAGARELHSRGRVLLALRDVPAALQAFWAAFQREPGFHRALVEWANAALRYSGKGWVRRQLEMLLAQHGESQAVVVSVGLALSAVDPKLGQDLLRRAMERNPQLASTSPTYAPRDSTESTTGRTNGEQDMYRTASESILAGRYRQALAAYEQAVRQNPAVAPVLAPLLAEMLTDELSRPEEARRVLEDAMRQNAQDYRLHLSHARVFLHLGFGDEAVSAANCALVLAPEAEKAIVLVQRAAAHLLLKDRERALADLAGAIRRSPELREAVRTECFLRPLARHSRFKALVAEPGVQQRGWEKFLRWLGKG